LRSISVVVRALDSAAKELAGLWPFSTALIRSVLWPRHRRWEEADAEELVGLAGGDARKEETSPALVVQQRRKTLNSYGRGWDEVYWR
jgi:hypothetical protein